MKSILIVINSKLHFRNYIDTNAFFEIEKKYDCLYLLSSDISKKKFFNKKKVIGSFEYREKIKKFHYKFFDLLAWKFRNRSTSFLFRVIRRNQIKLKYNFKNIFFSFFFNLIYFSYKKLKFSLYKFFFDKNFFFSIYLKHLLKKIKINKKIEHFIEKYKPDLVMHPSSGYDPVTNDIIRVCEYKKIPSFILIDNWDNLSSKTIFWFKPNHIGVWGLQSKEHGIKIQKLRKKNVHILGTPRYNNYFKVRDIKKIKSFFNFKYMLFCGTTLPFDEEKALEELNDIINKNTNIFKNIKIVYRPHPWRQANDFILKKKLNNVIIDPQVLGNYKNKKLNKDFMPDLSYYPSLIKNAELVINGLTSMIIESLIFRKKILILSYKEKNNITSPHNVYKYYTHFSRLQKIKSLTFCFDIKDLEKKIIYSWKQRKKINKKKIDNQRQYFCYNNSYTYSKRLKKIIDKLLINKAH